jgi:hypothetical protein
VIKRPGRPEEIATTVAFLVRRGVVPHGRDIPVDGATCSARGDRKPPSVPAPALLVGGEDRVERCRLAEPARRPADLERGGVEFDDRGVEGGLDQRADGELEQRAVVRRAADVDVAAEHDRRAPRGAQARLQLGAVDDVACVRDAVAGDPRRFESTGK